MVVDQQEESSRVKVAVLWHLVFCVDAVSSAVYNGNCIVGSLSDGIHNIGFLQVEYAESFACNRGAVLLFMASGGALPLGAFESQIESQVACNL